MIPRCRRQLITDAIPFLILFLAFVIRTLLADGFAVNPETKEIYMEPYKYFLNLMDMPLLLVLFLIGVVGVLWGIGKAVFSKTATNGIWFAGPGVVLTVLALLLCAGYNNTAYYPSTADLQSSLTLPTVAPASLPYAPWHTFPFWYLSFWYISFMLGVP